VGVISCQNCRLAFNRWGTSSESPERFVTQGASVTTTTTIMKCPKCNTEMIYNVIYNQYCTECDDHHYYKELDKLYEPEQCDLFKGKKHPELVKE